MRTLTLLGLVLVAGCVYGPRTAAPYEPAEIFQAKPALCEGEAIAGCLAFVRGVDLTNAVARAKCAGVGMVCADEGCKRVREIEGRRVFDACRFDTAYGPSVFSFTAPRPGEDHAEVSTALIGAYSLLIHELGSPLSASRFEANDDVLGGGGGVHVKGYTRKDGTRVKSHSRRR